MAGCAQFSPSPTVPGADEVPLLWAAVDEPEGIALIDLETSERVGLLPASSRALRFAFGTERSAREWHAEWLVDSRLGDAPVVHAFSLDWWSPKPEELEPGMAEIVAGRPRVGGRALVPLIRKSSTVSCLSSEDTGTCGTALRVLDASSAILAADNEEVLLSEAGRLRRLSLTNVVDGRLGPKVTLLVHRETSDGRVDDIVSRWESDGSLREILRAPVVIGVASDRYGVAYAIIRRDRRDLYEEMLAHAPEEFGGEALGGEAIRIDPVTGTEQPVRQLRDKSVRALVGF